MKERKNNQIFKMKRTIDSVVLKIWTKFEKQKLIFVQIIVIIDITNIILK